MGKRVAVAQGRRSRAKTHHDPSPVGEMAAGTISCGEETLHTHGWRPDGARLSCERAYGRGAPDPRRSTRGAAPLGRPGAHLGPPGGRRLRPRPPPADRPPGRRLHPPAGSTPPSPPPSAPSTAAWRATPSGPPAWVPPAPPGSASGSASPPPPPHRVRPLRRPRPARGLPDATCSGTVGPPLTRGGAGPKGEPFQGPAGLSRRGGVRP